MVLDSKADQVIEDSEGRIAWLVVGATSILTTDCSIHCYSFQLCFIQNAANLFVF